MRRSVPNVILVGLPATGKSLVGFRVARALHRPFFDTDHTPETVRFHRPPHVNTPGGGADGSDRSARIDESTDREWLTRVAATSGPCVIAAPWNSAGAVVDGSVGDSTVFLLDADLPTLVERFATDGADEQTMDELRSSWPAAEDDLRAIRNIAVEVIATDHRPVEELVRAVVSSVSAIEHARRDSEFDDPATHTIRPGTHAQCENEENE